jgi:integrase
LTHFELQGKAMLITAVNETLTELPDRLPTARTLGDVRDLLMAFGETDTPAKLQISAIKTVARASRCAPEDLPADPARLRQHLQSISSGMAGLTPGSWECVRSRILKALQRVDIPVMASRRTVPLSSTWSPLYQALPQDGSRAALGRLVGYLSDQGVSPGDVSDEVVGRFSRELVTGSLRGNPAIVVRAAIRGWNAAVDRVPGWPQQRLTPAQRGHQGYVLQAERFSPAFRTSLADYMAFLTDPPDEVDAPFMGLKPRTLRLREFQLRQIASALVHRGVPIEEIADVSELARRDNIDRACEFFIAHHGRPDAVQIGELLATLRLIAIHRLQDRELAAWISRRVKRLSGSQTRRYGMTEKNRRRIAVFRDPAHVRDLLLLPFKLLKRAESGTLPARNAAILMRAAVAIELEIMCPIRVQNLSEIDVDRDLVRSRRGKGASVHLFISGKRTKNEEDIELELPKQTVALIDLYLAKYRNQLIQPRHRGGTPRFLFPRPDGTVQSGKTLATLVCNVLLRELGIAFNIHLFRHLGCFLFLRSHPGQIDVMRRVLGHRKEETTRRFYSYVDQSDAFKLFDTHVLRIREDALRPRRKDPVVRGRSKP